MNADEQHREEKQGCVCVCAHLTADYNQVFEFKNIELNIFIGLNPAPTSQQVFHCCVAWHGE